jgi:predicted RNA binding protein with dsRBD fold (UPF0201 family)
MSKNITQKIRELLTPEDLKVFESAVERMIEEKTQDKLSALIQLKEEELKQLIILAANRALEQSYRTKEMEMAQAAKGIIPGI